MLLTREELQDRLIALHQASLELVKNVSLETLLERIVSMACEQSGAKYGALGVLGPGGDLKQFITVGMSADEIKRIPHPPRGLGLIGAMMHGDSGNIRIPEIRRRSAFGGFSNRPHRDAFVVGCTHPPGGPAVGPDLPYRKDQRPRIYR